MLSTVTPMGLLERAHAYKDKVAQGHPPDHGLFAYPVLMAADILALPLGCGAGGPGPEAAHRDDAGHGASASTTPTARSCSCVPEPYILDEVAVVPGTDGRKMSKTYGNTIEMFAPEGALKKSVMGIVTDSTPVEEPKDPKAPLFQLWALFADAAESEAMFARAKGRPRLRRGEEGPARPGARATSRRCASARAARPATRRRRGHAGRRRPPRPRHGRPVFEAARAAAGLGRGRS